MFSAMLANSKGIDEEDKTHWCNPESVESTVMLTVSSFPLVCPEDLEVGAVQVLAVVYQHLVSQQRTLHLWVDLFWRGDHCICSWLGITPKELIHNSTYSFSSVTSIRSAWSLQFKTGFSWFRDVYLISIFVDLHDIRSGEDILQWTQKMDLLLLEHSKVAFSHSPAWSYRGSMRKAEMNYDWYSLVLLLADVLYCFVFGIKSYACRYDMSRM